MVRPQAARPTARASRLHPLTRPDPSIDPSLRTSHAFGRARMVREVVERAKDLLMAQERLSEPEAFRRLQKTSMDTRTPMVKVAEAVLLADEVRRPDRRP